MNIRTLTPLAAALLLASGMTAASSSVAPTHPKSVSEILSIQHGLRDSLERHGGEYARFDADAVEKIERAQDKVFNMLRGVASLDELNEQQKTELSNALDEVKATLLANEGDRQICHHERRTGSNMVHLRCESVADREAHARQSQRAMEEISRSVQTTNGG